MPTTPPSDPGASGTLRREYTGDTVTDLVERARADFGDSLRIESTERIRTGGLAGFFAREGYRLVATGTPGGRVGAPAADPGGTDVLGAMLERADAADGRAEEADGGGPAEPGPVESESGESASAIRFAKVLARAEDLRVAEQGRQLAQHIVSRALDAAGTEAGPADEEPPRDGAPDRSAADAPDIRPVVFPVIDGPDARTEPDPGPAQGLAALTGLGLSDTALRPGDGTRDLRSATTASAAMDLALSLARPDPATEAGVRTVLLVGADREMWALAEGIAADLEVPEGRRWAEGPGSGGFRAASLRDLVDRVEGPAASTDTATGRLLALHAGSAGCPGLSAPARRMVEHVVARTQPDRVWAVVDATRKSADTAAWLGDLGRCTRLDGIVVHGTRRTATPLTVLEHDLPVVRLDRSWATAGAWAQLVVDRIDAERYSATRESEV